MAIIQDNDLVDIPQHGPPNDRFPPDLATSLTVIMHSRCFCIARIAAVQAVVPLDSATPYTVNALPVWLVVHWTLLTLRSRGT